MVYAFLKSTGEFKMRRMYSESQIKRMIENSNGKKLYKHYITVAGTTAYFQFQIVNDSQEAMTASDINEYLFTNGFNSTGSLYPATGRYSTVARTIPAVTGVDFENSTTTKTNLPYTVIGLYHSVQPNSVNISITYNLTYNTYVQFTLGNVSDIVVQIN